MADPRLGNEPLTALAAVAEVSARGFVAEADDEPQGVFGFDAESDDEDAQDGEADTCQQVGDSEEEVPEEDLEVEPSDELPPAPSVAQPPAQNGGGGSSALFGFSPLEADLGPSQASGEDDLAFVTGGISFDEWMTRIEGCDLGASLRMTPLELSGDLGTSDGSSASAPELEAKRPGNARPGRSPAGDAAGRSVGAVGPASGRASSLVRVPRPSGRASGATSRGTLAGAVTQPMSRTSSLVAGLLSGAQRLRGKASGPSVDADAQIPKVRNGNEATDEELAAYLDSWEERNRDKPAAADEDPRAEHTVGQSESESQSQRQRQSQRQSQRQRHSESQSLASTQVFMRSSSTRSTLREVKDGVTGQDLVLLVIVAVVLAYGLAKPGQDEAKKGFLGTEVATAAPRPAKAREPLSEDEVRQRIQDRDSFQNAESEIFGQTDLARASERLDDPDLQIRRQAVRTLASAGAIAADSVAASVTDVELWRVAEEGLARIASDDADLVLRVLQDRLEEVVEPGPRERVILAMAVCGGRAVPVLARLAASGASQVDRRAAVRALGATFDAAATPHLTQLLDGDDLELRVLAATSLGNLSRLDAAEALLPALEDREERIRKAVHRALMRLTGERFVASPSEWTRWWLQVGQPAARSVPEVQAAYPGTRGEERIRLLRPVAEFPDVRVTEMLRNSVHHRDHGVRRFAVCALAHHPIDRVGPDLIVALSDPIDAVQADALKALHALTGRDYADEAGWRAWWDGR